MLTVTYVSFASLVFDLSKGQTSDHPPSTQQSTRSLLHALSLTICHSHNSCTTAVLVTWLMEVSSVTFMD